MSFGDSKVGGFSGASRNDMGVSHLDKMGSSVGSRSSSSSSDSFQQALKEGGTDNALNSLISNRSSSVSKSEDGMNPSSTSSLADVATDADSLTSQGAEGSTDITDSLMSLIAKLVDVMANGGVDNGVDSVSAEPNSGSAETKGVEGSSATESAMGADSANGDEGSTNSQDPTQLLQMMLELITQLISMLQDKTAGTATDKTEGGEADSENVVDESGMPSVGEGIGVADAGTAATGASEASSNDAMGVGETENAEKIAEAEGVTDVAGTTSTEGGMSSQDTISLLQELLKLLTQMVDMMQGKSADATSGAENEEGSSGMTESATPASKAEAVPAEEGIGGLEANSDDSQVGGMEQLLVPLLSLLTELVSMMQGKSTEGAASTGGGESSENETPIGAISGTEGEESGENEVPVGETSGKESAMNVGEASAIEGSASVGEILGVDTEESADSSVPTQSLGDIVKLLTQLIEMLQGQSAEASSAEVAAEEGAAPESLDKDQLLEKVFMLLTQFLMQMMQQMGGGKD